MIEFILSLIAFVCLGIFLLPLMIGFSFCWIDFIFKKVFKFKSGPLDDLIN